jgi:hypothetical protein
MSFTKFHFSLQLTLCNYSHSTMAGQHFTHCVTSLRVDSAEKPQGFKKGMKQIATR